MKNYLVLFLLFASSSIFAQKIEISIACGLSHVSTIENTATTINYANIYKGNFNTFIFGLRFLHKSYKYFDLRTGIYLTEKGLKNRNGIQYDITHPHPYIITKSFSQSTYLDFPLLFSLHITKKIDVFAGTGICVNMSRDNLALHSVFDIPINTGFSFQNKTTSLDFMYSLGTIPYAIGYNYIDKKDNYFMYTNNQFSIILGIALNKKKAK